jgi:L-ornithine N5-oxygenase
MQFGLPEVKFINEVAMTMNEDMDPNTRMELPAGVAVAASSRSRHHRPEAGGAYDVVGAGYGPAGIALAVAMEDAEEAGARRQGWRSLFLEQAPDSSWQSNMLLPGTDIQHHFLRDFATPRNPRSRYTFPNYLKEKGRLFSFGLLGGNAGRVEWDDYVRWVAEQVRHRAAYNYEVVAVEPVPRADASQVDLVGVQARDLVQGTVQTFLARNLVIATGRKPNVPKDFAPFVGEQMFHSHSFLRSMQAVRHLERPTFAVVGSGQNAIEIILHLADRFPNSEIYSISRNSGFRLYDLGHFSNEVYFPEDVEYFFSLPKEARHRLYEDVKYTNYSSVDQDVSRALYWRVYEDRVRGTSRIHVIKRSSVVGCEQRDGRFEIALQDIYRGVRSVVRADIVVLCTGYVEEKVPAILEPLRPYLRYDHDGDLIVSRDYEVASDDRLRVGIYLNGLTERTHGISDAASFSMMALKAQRILEALDARLARAGASEAAAAAALEV